MSSSRAPVLSAGLFTRLSDLARAGKFAAVYKGSFETRAAYIVLIVQDCSLFKILLSCYHEAEDDNVEYEE